MAAAVLAGIMFNVLQMYGADDGANLYATQMHSDSGYLVTNGSVTSQPARPSSPGLFQRMSDRLRGSRGVGCSQEIVFRPAACADYPAWRCLAAWRREAGRL